MLILFHTIDRTTEKILIGLEIDKHERSFVGPIPSIPNFNYSSSLGFDIKILVFSYDMIVLDVPIAYTFNDLEDISDSSRAETKIWEFQDYYKVPRIDSTLLDRKSLFDKKKFLIELMQRHSLVGDTIELLNGSSFSYKPKEIPKDKMLEALHNGASLVEGYRNARSK